MAKYEVVISFNGVKHCSVDAKSLEDAIDLAELDFSEMSAKKIADCIGDIHTEGWEAK